MTDLRRGGARYPLQDLALVIWERDYRRCAPYTLYIVMGPVDPAPDYPAKLVRPLDVSSIRPIMHKGIAAESELVPIGAFGLVAEPFPGLGLLKLTPTSDFPKDCSTSSGHLLRWHRHVGMPSLDFETGVHADFHDVLVKATARDRRAA